MQIGLGILANNNSRNTGQVLGKGALQGINGIQRAKQLEQQKKLFEMQLEQNKRNNKRQDRQDDLTQKQAETQAYFQKGLAKQFGFDLPPSQQSGGYDAANPTSNWENSQAQVTAEPQPQGKVDASLASKPDLAKTGMLMGILGVKGAKEVMDYAKLNKKEVKQDNQGNLGLVDVMNGTFDIIVPAQMTQSEAIEAFKIEDTTGRKPPNVYNTQPNLQGVPMVNQGGAIPSTANQANPNPIDVSDIGTDMSGEPVTGLSPRGREALGLPKQPLAGVPMQGQAQPSATLGTTESLPRPVQFQGEAPAAYRKRMDSWSEATQKLKVKSAEEQIDFNSPERVKKRAELDDFKKSNAQNILNVIDETLTKADGWSTGGVGGVMADLPLLNTDAKDVEALTKTIDANLSFDRLQKMREMSETGGALGAIAVKELELLGSSVRNIQPFGQSPAQFKKQMEVVRGHYKKYLDTIKSPEYLKELNGGGGSQGDILPKNATMPTVDQYDTLQSGAQYKDPQGNIRTKR